MILHLKNSLYWPQGWLAYNIDTINLASSDLSGWFRIILVYLQGKMKIMQATCIFQVYWQLFFLGNHLKEVPYGFLTARDLGANIARVLRVLTCKNNKIILIIFTTANNSLNLAHLTLLMAFSDQEKQNIKIF